jgi:small subunit ribosomal protein S6
LKQLYEGMFLLDNQVVRDDWKAAKTAVKDTLGKYGAEVVAARRWDERRLTYPIRGKRRATYLLTWFKGPDDSVNGMRRDFDLDERVLRYLLLKAEALPEGELELAAAEDVAGYSPPPPPQDDDVRESHGAEAPAALAPLDEEPAREVAPDGLALVEEEVPEEEL